MKLLIKPLSVNECWQGKRFKTPAYKVYEKALMLMLPKLSVPSGKIKMVYTFGFSNTASDLDNPVKAFTDILQKKYSFNDKYIYELVVKKVIVKKGQEFVEFEISPIED